MENIERLKYKTRGEQIPQGIPKVFYCCHPKDFDRFFESVSDEILAKQNCAVFYDSTPDAERDEQFFLDLKQMQLFVMPVTSELLYIENTALSELFPFAIENHIPVLPLMQESGLDKVFNEKCGDLQFLDKNVNDATAISYDEKLEKYLSSVLIGDEMAEKIRNAFDAYIFLSYRKKDRKYAQELMKLIHKNDFCRDIAIWYDEFLTPGENFNDSIKAAFEKSGLFVLAVTPNLVNEVNYVMTTEYPMAREAGKLILPAELVETDKNLLAEKYEGIPECTDAYNDEMLSSALLESVKNIALKENDKNPEHNFFIGLAYLGGVDVEVDHEKAVELITFAAEHNVVEAIDKLVEMYRTGYGVERDYLKAIEWQEKLIKIAEEKYNADPSEDNQSELFCVIIDCGDYYQELAKLGKAKEKFEQVKVLLDSIAFDDLTNTQKRNYSVSCERLGNICKAEGDPKGARGYYEKMFEINLKLAEETGTVEVKRDLSVSYGKFGDICKAEGDLRGAREYYEKLLEISLMLAEKTGTVRAKRDLSVSYDNLGGICYAEGNLSSAKEYHEKSLEIRFALAKETGTVEAKRDLSISYHNLGGICYAEGNLSSAKEYHEKSLEIAIALAKETGTVEAKRALAASYNNLDYVCRKEGNLSRAKEYCEKCLEIAVVLAKETGTVEAKRELSVSYNNFGDICRAEGNLSGAKEYYEKSLEIRLTLAKETATVQTKRDLSVIYSNLGYVCQKEGNLSVAKEYYEKGLEIAVALAKEMGTAESYDDLATSYYNFAFCDVNNKTQYLKKAVDIYEMLVENCPDIARYKKNLKLVKRKYEKAYKQDAMQSFFNKFKSKFQKNKK